MYFTTQIGATHKFVWSLTVALMEKDIDQITHAILVYAEQCIRGRPESTTCYTTMNLATCCPRCLNMAGGMFQPGDDAVVECVRCRQVLYVNLELAVLQFNLYCSIPLQHFIVPRVNDVWSAENVFLRCMIKGERQCHVCRGTTFKWLIVPFEPTIAGYPMVLFIQRHRPSVEGVLHSAGSVPITAGFKIGNKYYTYSGWTAKMCDMSMVPFLKVNDKKFMRYSLTPGGLVQFITDRNHEFPKDPRHVDMLIYKITE